MSGTALRDEQQDIFEEIKDLNRMKWLDEEKLRAMIRTAVKEGSPGDDKNKICLAGFV